MTSIHISKKNVSVPGNYSTELIFTLERLKESELRERYFNRN